MKCILCGNGSLDVLTEELRNGKGRVLYCGKCDLGILENQIQDPKKYYAEEYRKTHKNMPDENTPAKIFTYMYGLQTNRLNIVLPFMRGSSESILEIGCSAGQFLAHFDRDKNTLFGVEYDPACRAFVTRRLGIEVFDELPEAGGFDHIAMFQVLEHTQDPLPYLMNIYNHLCTGGYLYIEVPNLKDPLCHLWEDKEYKKFYFHEAHNFYFTKKSLEKLVKQAGFQVVETHYIQEYSLYADFKWHFQKKGMGAMGMQRLGEDVPINGILNTIDTLYRLLLQEQGYSTNLFTVGRKL